MLFQEAILSDISLNDSFNFKAQSVVLDVNYTDAFFKKIQIKGIEADNVTLVFNYTSEGDSNFHKMQKSLRQYIKTRKQVNKSSIQWDVYTVMLRGVTVHINDFDYGKIGTFQFDNLTIPHVSSKFTGKNNRDILFAAIAKEISKQFINDEIQGSYDKAKLMRFVARESKAELDTFFSLSKEKLAAKARSAFMQLKQTVQSQQ